MFSTVFEVGVVFVCVGFARPLRKVLLIIYCIMHLRESRRRKSNSCRQMRRPTADFENTGIVYVFNDISRR